MKELDNLLTAVNIHINAYLSDFHVLYTLDLSAVLADKTATKKT